MSVFFIAEIGINHEGDAEQCARMIDAAAEAGADAICVTAAVGAAPDPEAAAAQLVKVIEDAGGRV